MIAGVDPDGRGREAGDADQPGAAPAGSVEVEQGEGYVVAVPVEHLGRHPAQLLLPAQVGQPGAQFGERPYPPFPDDPAGGLRDDAEDAADGTAVVAYRIVGDVEVGLLLETVPGEQEEVVGTPVGAPVARHPVEQRAEHLLPDLRPELPSRSAEEVGMLGAHHRDVGIVVEDDAFGAPEEDDRATRVEHGGHRVPQGRWPVGQSRAECGRRPVESGDPVAHVTATGQRRGQVCRHFVPVGPTAVQRGRTHQCLPAANVPTGIALPLAHGLLPR